MEVLLKSICVTSLAGGALCLLLLCCKPVTTRLFSARWHYYVWLAALLAFVLPVSIRLPAKAPEAASLPPLQMAVEQAVQGMAPAPSGQEAAFHSWLWLVPYLWLGGALLFFLGGVGSYLRFLRLVKQHSRETGCPALEQLKKQAGIRGKIRVRTTGLMNAPLLTGIFCPTLLLPENLPEGEGLRYILLHELTHYKRRDLWIKWFALAVNALHFFNPLAYLAVRQLGEACEISCDITVTKNMDDNQKRGYMNTILCLAAEKKGAKCGV